MRRPLPFKGNIRYVPCLPIEYIRHNSNNLLVTPKFLHRLKESLKTEGMQNPIIGETVQDRVQVGPGKQRLRAAIELGWDTVPVMVWDKHNIIPNLRVEFEEVPTDAGVIEAFFFDDHEVDRVALSRGNLAIKKTVNWRDKQ